ncbi:MAG: hypothetical protein ABIS69_01115 [Sediminibacterium sp.]
MKRNIALACLLSFIGLASSAQIINAQGNNLQDFNGKPIMSTKVSETEGNYFVDENYQKAIMVLANGKQLPDMKVKLDLKNNKVYYINEEGAEMEAVTKVKRIVFTDKGTVFENGFPAVNKQDQGTFYKVIISGKASLLSLTQILESEYKEFNSATTTKRIDKVTEIYGASPNAITRLSKEEDVIQLLADKKKEVYGYIVKNNLKCKKQVDYENIINYYNAL